MGFEKHSYKYFSLAKFIVKRWVNMIPVEKDRVYKAVVETILGNNEGLAHIDGFPVYIKGMSTTDKGKTVNVKITSIKRYYCLGKRV